MSNDNQPPSLERRIAKIEAELFKMQREQNPTPISGLSAPAKHGPNLRDLADVDSYATEGQVKRYRTASGLWTSEALPVDGFGGSVVSETTFGQSTVLGTGTTAAHANHSHGSPSLSGTVTDETTYGISPAPGSGSTAAKGDHTHGTPDTVPPAPSVRIQRTTDQTISDNTVTAIAFGATPTIDYQYGTWDADAGDGIYFPLPGLYYIFGGLTWEDHTTGEKISAGLRFNPAYTTFYPTPFHIGFSSESTATGHLLCLTVSTVWEVPAADDFGHPLGAKVELTAYQNTGVSKDVIVDEKHSPVLGAHYLGPAGYA